MVCICTRLKEKTEREIALIPSLQEISKSVPLQTMRRLTNRSIAPWGHSIISPVSYTSLCSPISWSRRRRLSFRVKVHLIQRQQSIVTSRSLLSERLKRCMLWSLALQLVQWQSVQQDPQVHRDSQTHHTYFPQQTNTEITLTITTLDYFLSECRNEHLGDPAFSSCIEARCYWISPRHLYMDKKISLIIKPFVVHKTLPFTRNLRKTISEKWRPPSFSLT